jgi:hypothetical protein
VPLLPAEWLTRPCPHDDFLIALPKVAGTLLLVPFGLHLPRLPTALRVGRSLLIPIP